MAVWDKGAISILIGLYEEEPVLWDPNHPKFEHEMKSSEAWERITARIGPYISVNELERKMVSLKQMYHQHKRGNTILMHSDLNDFFHRLDPFLGKTLTYVITTSSTQVQKIKDIEGVKVALDQELRDITKDLSTTKDDVKELTQQVVNLQLENNTLREEVQKIGDIECIKVALGQKLKDITKDLATKDDVKELTQQVVNLQLENNTLREEFEKIGDIEDVKVALDQTLRDITKDLATSKDDVKELTQQVVNLQLENNTLRGEVEKIGYTEDVKVKDAGVPQHEDVCGLYGKLLVEKLRQLPARERHFRMLEIDGTFSRDFDVK